MPSQFIANQAVTGHYSTTSQGSVLHLSPDFMVDLLRCTVSISEAFREHKLLVDLFDMLHAANHLPNGDLTRREICGLLAFELTYACYRYCHAGSSECPDFPGVFDYEVPGLLLNRYYEDAKTRKFGDLPSQAWMRSASTKLIHNWFNPDPEWAATFSGHVLPVVKSAPHLPAFLQLLNEAGLDPTRIIGIRQIPE